MAFCHQAQEAFFEGHVLAFEHFGGVPARIRYDNLKAAVVKVLLGRDRLENERFMALRSHYGFDSFYCLPGIEGAHEKGGVEGEVGRFRRRHLVPVPRVARPGRAERVDRRGRRRRRRAADRPAGRHASARRPRPSAAWLRPLPEERVRLGRGAGEVRVDTKGRICVRQSFYSVPVRLARRSVAVRLGAQAFEVVADGRVVARHERSLHKGTEDLVLDHYLEILVRKPGAMPGLDRPGPGPGVRGVQRRSTSGSGTEARRQLGDGAGTRALIGVLLLHRRAARRRW